MLFFVRTHAAVHMPVLAVIEPSHASRKVLHHVGVAEVAAPRLRIRRCGHVGLTARYPWVVAFGFGLLHGVGFATALTTLGIPQAALPIALLFFNVGVEIGQLAFVFVVLALMWAHQRTQTCCRRWSAALPAYVIGSVAAFWFLLRV
jgi:hypothetical protein